MASRHAIYVGIAAAAALVSFLSAPLFLRAPEPPQPAPLEFREDAWDTAAWAKRFPIQWEAWRHPAPGPSVPAGRLETYQEKRGHFYSLKDRDESLPLDDPRFGLLYAGLPKRRPQPGGCLSCHACLAPAWRRLGQGDPARGFEIFSNTPYYEARRSVNLPVGCPDCHEPQSMRLRVTRPAFLRAYEALPKGRNTALRGPNDAQRLRVLVCAQCHSGYTFSGEDQAVAHPFSAGLTLEEIETSLEALRGAHYAHAVTGALLWTARHPQFELWSQGAHAAAGVACADCHMPFIRRGAARLADHAIRRPLTDAAPSCLSCHGFSAAEMQARARAIQDVTRSLLGRAAEALLDLVNELRRARDAGAGERSLETARSLQRRAQFRLDFVAADRSGGFHAPQEAARLLAESVDLARQGQMAARRARLQVQ